MPANKVENFDIEVVHRRDVLEAEYNPRQISKEARQRLKRFLKKDGLLAPLTWNRRTRDLVSGHQRLSLMDDIMGTDDYELTVAVVDMDEKSEIAANVKMNNPSMQGEWDYSILQEVKDLGDFDVEKDFGFDSTEASLIWADLNKTIETTPLPKNTFSDAEIQKFREIKKESRDKAKTQNTDGKGYAPAEADFYVTIIFDTSAEKRRFVEAVGEKGTAQRITAKQFYEWLHGQT